MKKLFLMVTLLLIFDALNAQCNGMILKITKGKLEKYDNNGNYKGSITTDALDSDCNNELVFVVKLNGKVEKYDFNGNYRGSITTDARKARVNGDMILVTKENGKVEKYDFNGNYRGSI
jgi:hypothetical protein